LGEAKKGLIEQKTSENACLTFHLTPQLHCYELSSHETQGLRFRCC